MKKIFILAPSNAVMEAIANPRYLFTAANQFLEAAGKPALFDVKLVGDKAEIHLAAGSYSVHPDVLLQDSGQGDLVIIPALFGDIEIALKNNRSLVPWIQTQYHNGAEVASLCMGAFLLAETGLLDGKSCSTHWAFLDELRERFPAVDVLEGKIITAQERIYTSGGANSYWNLLLYLLETYTSRETAILAAKYFAIDIDRHDQSAFMIFTGQKSHQDPAIIRVQNYIESNFSESLRVNDLAEMVAVSRRSFERRFLKATRNTVTQYIQRVRIEAAKRSFESSRKSIGEVMYEVGYMDTRSFRNVFKKVTGLTPMAYRDKYKKLSADTDSFLVS